MATITRTIKPSGGGDYNSLADWEYGENTDLIAAGETHIAECYAGDLGPLSLSSGWASDSANKLIIRAAEGEQHQGIATEDKAYAARSGGDIVYVSSAGLTYLEITGIQFWWTSDVTYKSQIKQYNGSLLIVDKCLFKGRGGDLDGATGIISGNVTSNVLFVTNSIFYDFTSSSNIYTAGIRTQSASDATIYNCTFYNCKYGIRADTATPLVKNCVLISAGVTGRLDSASSNNVTSGVVFVDVDNDNFALDATDTVARDMGADLSADGTWAFSDDILGNTRESSSWDIGAFEYVAASSNNQATVTLDVADVIAAILANTNAANTAAMGIAMEDVAAGMVADVHAPNAANATVAVGDVGMSITASLAEVGLVIHTLLDFSNASNLGADSSGNGNDWTLTGATQSTDTPTNNLCTLHPLDPATIGTLSDGNLTTTGDAKVTLRPTSGKWYYEKDGVGVSYDADTSGPFDPVLTAGTYNFGATTWNDSGPAAGFLPLCDASLPDPAVLNLSEHVLIATFTAPVGAAQDITVGWDAENTDWGLRLKNLSSAESWRYISTVAGLGYTNNAYYSAGGSPKVALTTPLSVSGSTITIPADLLTNGSTYAVEVFRVGAESGFNIVTYTGTGALNTVAHGMGRVPFAVAVMPNDANAHPWVLNTTGTGWNGALSMLLTNAFTVSASVWNNTAPTSTIVTFGTDAAVNAAGNAYQMWVWSDVGVYSEIDYIGTGVAGAGSVASLGGTPEAVMFLKDANGAYNWPVQWAMRSEYNPVNEYIYSNVYNGESAGTVIALLSNGFKTITTNGYNVSGHRHVGVAVVHNPKYRNAY